MGNLPRACPVKEVDLENVDLRFKMSASPCEHNSAQRQTQKLSRDGVCYVVSLGTADTEDAS